MSNEYYVFDNEQTAINAEQFIVNVAGLPKIGKRASDGMLQRNKQQTLSYAKPVQRLDGKWIFPRVKSSDLLQIPANVINSFNNNYPHTIEDSDASWFAVSNI